MKPLQCSGRVISPSPKRSRAASRWASSPTRSEIGSLCGLAEAPSYGQAGVVFDPTSKGALRYIEFAREMVERVKALA